MLPGSMHNTFLRSLAKNRTMYGLSLASTRLQSIIPHNMCGSDYVQGAYGHPPRRPVASGRRSVQTTEGRRQIGYVLYLL